MWNGGGQPWIHSTFVLTSSVCSTLRFEAKASQIMNISMITAVREMSDPTDEIVFHRV